MFQAQLGTGMPGDREGVLAFEHAHRHHVPDGQRLNRGRARGYPFGRGS
jgi:hypothetical protein